MVAKGSTDLPATVVCWVLRRRMASVKFKSRPTRSGPSVALHVDRRFKTASLSSEDYGEQSKKLMESTNGGPPRWFSPLECGIRSTGSPLLLFLPGIDGDGLGLMLHHKKLGKIFDIWCLHIPVMDRTPLNDLVALVESTIRSEHEQAAQRPIYLVGESVGASLALVVAARNPHIDLVLILANPATSFRKSLLQSVMPLSDMIHKLLDAGLHHQMSTIPVETILWKLKMIHEMQMFLNSHLHAVKAQTLILNSGKDILLSSITEGERLRGTLGHCEILSFVGNGGPLLLDDDIDLVSAIRRVCYYRRGACVDYVSDFLPLTPSEFKIEYEQFRWMDVAFDSVMLSTMDSGKVQHGLAGIPSEGPVLLVGNHMMLGMELPPLVSGFYSYQNIMVRGMAHPALFKRLKDGILPDVSLFDFIRVFGGVPVSATNLYKLFSLKSHVLLYPGGLSEALHRKGEDSKLIWPVEPEFVRMAARFGATIVPFGVVGEDDVVQLLLDCDDQMKIPPLKAFIEDLNSKVVRLRSDAKGAIGKQILYCPFLLPKLPGRFYFLFGKPILTEGRTDILRDKDKAREMYMEIQAEIEKCITYLKEKREKDPYRNLLPRLAYKSFHGFDSQVPTFEA